MSRFTYLAYFLNVVFCYFYLTTFMRVKRVQFQVLLLSSFPLYLRLEDLFFSCLFHAYFIMYILKVCASTYLSRFK